MDDFIDMCHPENQLKASLCVDSSPTQALVQIVFTHHQNRTQQRSIDKAQHSAGCGTIVNAPSVSVFEAQFSASDGPMAKPKNFNQSQVASRPPVHC